MAHSTGGRVPRSDIARTRRMIQFKISLSVLLGQLDEQIAEVWLDTIDNLDDAQIEALIRTTRVLEPGDAMRATLRYLMQNYYPFKELILYRTDDAFKKRLGLEDSDLNNLHSPN